MKFKLIAIVNCYVTLNIIKEHNELTFDLAWMIADISGALQLHYERFEQEKVKILHKFGSLKDEKTGLFEIAPENVEAYKKAAQELENHEITIQVEKLKRKDFQTISVPKGTNVSTLKIILE